MITNAVNPPSAPATPDPFIIYSTSLLGNAQYRCSTPLTALPELEIGPLYNLAIDQHDTDYVLSSTNYTISFTTSSDIPLNGEFIFNFPS